MFTTTVILSAAMAVAAAAQPHAHHGAAHMHAHREVHNKRGGLVTEYTTVTTTLIVTEVVDLSTTLWITPGQPQGAHSTGVAGQFFETTSTSSSTPAAAPPPPPPPPPPPAVSSAPAPVVAPPPPSNTPPPPPVSVSTPAAAAPPAASVPAANKAGESTGDLTFFDLGVGACGIDDTNQGTAENVVALARSLFTAANPNKDPLCGKTITLTYGGKSTTAKVHDSCPPCAPGDVDASLKIWSDLGIDTSLGRVKVDWSFN